MASGDRSPPALLLPSPPPPPTRRTLPLLAATLLALGLLLLWTAGRPSPSLSPAASLASWPAAPRLLRRAAPRLVRVGAQPPRPPDIGEEYRNAGTQLLSAFVPSEPPPDFLDRIDWGCPKRRRTSLDRLARDLEAAIGRREWFVTGDIDPAFFSDDFAFQDPDVKIRGVEGYARGVNKIFRQGVSRAEVIAARANDTVPDTITVTWRLSGIVNVGPGLPIKPYVVYTDFRVSPDDGLIVFQEDRQGLPGYDIVLSAFLPFLVPRSGGLLAPPAPPVEVLRREFQERERAAGKPAVPSQPGTVVRRVLQDLGF